MKKIATHEILRRLATLSASEALYGFCGWLTTREDQTIMSGHDDAGHIADLVDVFCKTNKLKNPKEGWEKDLIHPRYAGNVVICKKCHKDTNYDKQPEIAMGSIKCPHCGSIVNQEGETLKKKADYPDHPDDVVIHREELLAGTREIKEIDVYRYYEGIKSKMLPDLKGKNLFIGIKLKGILKGRQKPLIVRHPYDKKTDYIRIENDRQFKTYHSGRTVEFHTTMSGICDCYVVDFDATSFDQAKSVTADIADKLQRHSDVKNTDIRYTGKRGFHVLGWLKKAQPINEARDNLKEWLKVEFGDRDDVVVGESPKDSKGALGLTSMKINAGQIALWSLRPTGLCCVEVPRKALPGFKMEDATIDKVYEKATGKAFPWGTKKESEEKKRMALKVAASFIKAIIRKCPEKDKDSRPDSEQQWCLYTHDGDRLLGRHPSKEKALNQERAVQVHKH